MNRGVASNYIRRCFEPSDRLAVVLLNKRSGAVTQRLASAERIASPEFQSWLRHENAHKHEIYVSMNVLRGDARGRTKDDIATIRHIYLDFDKNGSAALRTLFNRSDMPVPSFIVNTSPNKWQVIWQAEGFTKDTAEDLQKRLARETGADLAATDCTRVLRLPGFYNHKYERPYLVRAEPHAAMAGTIYRPEDFPEFRRDRPNSAERLDFASLSKSGGALSQSERDWAYAKRALARGDSPEMVAAAIAVHRRYEKHNPQDYAELTVKKAAQSLNAETRQIEDRPER